MPDKNGYSAKPVRRPLSPLIRPEEWVPRVPKPRNSDPKPGDMWAVLPDADRKAMERPLR